jgi:ferrous iron transport protein B
MAEDINREVRVALAGNPNAGKTSLFNALTGAHHKVGNYPGVTVEKREGELSRNGRVYRFIDLPGIYSLTAYSMDEVVTRDFLLDEKPDVILDVLDSTNLERHLYLCLQFQELGLPLVGALNMSDEAESKGLKIDEAALSAILGIPMAKTVGFKGNGIEGILDLVDAVADGEAGNSGNEGEPRSIRYGEEVETRIAALEKLVGADPGFAKAYPARWMAVKLLEKDDNARQRLAIHPDASAIAAKAAEAVAWIEGHFGKDAEIVISEQRYGYIRGALKEAVSVARKPDFSFTEAIDKIVMHPLLALPIFIGILWAVFQLTFAVGAYPAAWLQDLFLFLGKAAGSILPAGPVRSLVVDGVIGGVGGVFSFVPYIVILFFFLSILEDSGYMSRAAFATDKILHAFGMHGQSALPMILGFGCSVPAIMAARALKSRRDRIITILVIPFMSCSAKLPVYVLFAAAFFPRNPTAAVLAVYAIGVATSMLAALVLRRTVLNGKPTPFVMELPPYRAPTLKGIAWHVREKTMSYVKKAGTVILAASVLIWALTAFPAYAPSAEELAGLRSEAVAQHPGLGPAEADREIGALVARRRTEGSAAGMIGKFIEPAFRPLGFDWKLAVATVTGFAAKEVTVSTLGVLYGSGENGNQGLIAALRADPGFNPATAFAFMLFTLAIPPCLAALATIRSELGWKWLGFAFAFMLGVGWLLAFASHGIGALIPIA